MVYLPLAVVPAVLLGVTGTLAANTDTHTLTANTTAASIVPPPSTGAPAAASISHHTLYSGDTTVTATAKATATAVPDHANTNAAPDADTDADTDTDEDTTRTTTSTEFFHTVQRDSKICRRGGRRCDCSKSPKEIDEINRLRAEKNCPKCVCLNGQRVNGAAGGAAGTGQLVKGVVAAVVGVAGVMALV